MKSKIWITSLLISIVILGGCSADSSESDENMEHSNMTQEDMQMEDGTESDMENSHMSHNDPLTLNDSTGENELIIPPVLEHEDDEGIVYNIEAQGSTEFFDGYQTETYGYNGSFLGPVIRVNRGETVKIRTSNKLSDETTFHWHG